MKRTLMYSWNNGESSKLLAEALGIKRIKHKNSRYVPGANDTIINWGINPVTWEGIRTINPSNLVRNTVDKKKFFEVYRAADDVNFDLPWFWTNKEDATQWLQGADAGERTLVCRTIVNGHEGAGIILTDDPTNVPNAPLYTQYIKKKAEYRIHVVNGEVIDEVQKKRRAGEERVGDHRIRNTANGYVFCRTDVLVPVCVRDAAVRAMAFYKLDFGAVDVIYNEHYDRAFVLEINSAPGIEGTTLARYTEAFRKNYL